MRVEYSISNSFLIISSQHLRFMHIIWDFLGGISGLNSVHIYVSLMFLY